MGQLTMTIDDALLRAAEKRAVETGRAVSDIAGDALAREIGFAPHAPDDDEAALLGFSTGRLSRRQAMDDMGLPPDKYAEFVEAMNRSGTPWPPIDRTRVDTDGEVVVRAISEALVEG